jgi:hypothetical protein
VYFQDVPADPEGLLLGIFQYCIDEAKAESLKHGCEADRLGVTISSELLDHDILLPIRPFTDNTAEALLNLFMKVAHSKKQQGITLWGQPFQVRVTTVRRAGLNCQKKLVGGAPPIPTLKTRDICDQGLIKVDDF